MSSQDSNSNPPPSAAVASLPIMTRKRGKFMNVPATKRLYKPSLVNAADATSSSGASRTTTTTSHPTWWTSLWQEQSKGNDVIALQDLPEEVIYKITAYLDAPCLIRLRCTNTFWERLAAKNQAGWDTLCTRLWKDKVHVCPRAIALKQQAVNNEMACLQAYKTSLQDAANRHFVWPAEFLYDETTQSGTVWSFRFKESAGADWTQLDPWYAGQPARRMVFLPDGTCRPYHANENNNNNSNANRPPDDPLVAPMNWRFITRPMDLPTKNVGSYVRITVGGRDVPTYAVKRSPVGNWGFVMESCWGLFASFELPLRHAPTTIMPTSTATEITRNNPTRRRHLRRTSDGHTQWVDEDDEDDQGEQQNYQHDPWALLRDDTHLFITNEIQLREAFLYNVGARILPEGEEATDDFDRAWGGLGV